MKYLILSIVMVFAVLGCHSKPSKPDVIVDQPPQVVCQADEHLVLGTNVCVKNPVEPPKPIMGHIVITGDFSPQCPAVPGFVPPKAGDQCEVGYHQCSGGAVYNCVDNK